MRWLPMLGLVLLPTLVQAQSDSILRAVTEAKAKGKNGASGKPAADPNATMKLKPKPDPNGIAVLEKAQGKPELRPKPTPVGAAKPVLKPKPTAAGATTRSAKPGAKPRPVGPSKPGDAATRDEKPRADGGPLRFVEMKDQEPSRGELTRSSRPRNKREKQTHARGRAEVLQELLEELERQEQQGRERTERLEAFLASMGTGPAKRDRAAVVRGLIEDSKREEQRAAENRRATAEALLKASKRAR